MAMDGRLLARARARLAERRAENEAEEQRRQSEVYSRLPRVEYLDAELRRLIAGVVGRALRRGEDTEKAVADAARESLALQEQRRALLSGAGYPEDYLDEIYSCRLCSDTGFVNGVPCSCLRALYRDEQSRDLSDLIRLGSESFENFDLSLYDENDPDPAVGMPPRKWMSEILDYCKRYADGFGKGSPNLLLRGGTGLGKTYTSACIARRVSAAGVSVVYETVSGALEPFELVKFGRPDPEDAAWDARGRILDCGLLILDDLGTEMQTAFSVSALYTIVNTRLIGGKKTIISTNLGKAELRERYGAQLFSRLEGEYITLLFVGSDIRLRKKSIKQKNPQESELLKIDKR